MLGSLSGWSNRCVYLWEFATVVTSAATVMAAGLSIIRILLVFLLSEVDFSSAFPAARSSMFPRAWQDVGKKQLEGYDYGTSRLMHYIRAVRQPNLHNQVKVKTLQRPLGRSLKVRTHAQIQNQPGLYHQTHSPYPPSSDVTYKQTQKMSPPLTPRQRNHPPTNTRNFEFQLKVPIVDYLGQGKDCHLITQGSGLNSDGSEGVAHVCQKNGPNGVQIYGGFNTPSDSDFPSDKDSTNYPDGTKTAHNVLNPSFQFSLTVPNHHHPPPSTTTYPQPSSSHGAYLANRPGRVGIAHNSDKDLTKLQSSSTQRESGWNLLNSGSNVQRQMEHQKFEPIHTSGKRLTFSPEHSTQYTIPNGQVTLGKIPNKQIQLFQTPPPTFLSIPEYRPLQSDNVQHGYYTAQKDPTSNDYGTGQGGQTVSYVPTNIYFSEFHSGQYDAGQAKPIDCIEPTVASKRHNFGQFQPYFDHVKKVATVSHPTPVEPSSPTFAPSPYKIPTINQVVATNYHGTGNVAQTRKQELSSSSLYQSIGGHHEQAARPDRTAFDLLLNFQGPSTDSQTQMRPPGQSTDRGQPNGKPKYTKLFIDFDDDATDDDYDYY